MAAYYIARNSPGYAQALVDRITRRTDALAATPMLGAAVPEYSDESIREVLEHPYRIIYRGGTPSTRTPMTDLEALRLYSPTVFEFTTATTRIKQALPPDLRVRFNTILKNYLLSYGIDGAYERLNNRSVAQIFAEYQPGDPHVIASGEVDGVGYQLSAPPPPRPTDDRKPEG